MPATQRGQAYPLASGKWGLRYYDRDGVRQRLSPFPSGEAALQHYDLVIEPQLLANVAPLRHRRPSSTQPVIPARLREAIASSRRNAKRRDIPWRLTNAEAARLWERCGGRCELSGIQFDLGPTVDRGRRRPFAPSLDRIDPRRGYAATNLRLICVVANIALNEWGLEPLLRLAEALTGQPPRQIRSVG